MPISLFGWLVLGIAFREVAYLSSSSLFYIAIWYCLVLRCKTLTFLPNYLSFRPFPKSDSAWHTECLREKQRTDTSGFVVCSPKPLSQDSFQLEMCAYLSWLLFGESFEHFPAHRLFLLVPARLRFQLILESLSGWYLFSVNVLLQALSQTWYVFSL